MGEATANSGCGIVMEGGVATWQLWYAQSTPPAHGFVTLSASEFDEARLATRIAGLPGLLNALPAAESAEVQTWPATVQADVAAVMAVVPHSSAWH